MSIYQLIIINFCRKKRENKETSRQELVQFYLRLIVGDVLERVSLRKYRCEPKYIQRALFHANQYTTRKVDQAKCNSNLTFTVDILKPITEKLIVINEKNYCSMIKRALIKIAKKKKFKLNRFEMISYDFRNRVLQIKYFLPIRYSLIAKLCYSCPMPIPRTWGVKRIFSTMLTFENLCGRTSALKEVGKETE